jgi:hypothetical protein
VRVLLTFQILLRNVRGEPPCPRSRGGPMDRRDKNLLTLTERRVWLEHLGVPLQIDRSRTER